MLVPLESLYFSAAAASILLAEKCRDVVDIFCFATAVTVGPFGFVVPITTTLYQDEQGTKRQEQKEKGSCRKKRSYSFITIVRTFTFELFPAQR
jgi:hypothetical protein